MTTLNPTLLPDARGYFGDFGGVFIPETLRHAVQALHEAYAQAIQDASFTQELEKLLKDNPSEIETLLKARGFSNELIESIKSHSSPREREVHRAQSI